MPRILGIDFGDSRIGLALSDPMQIIGKPFLTISNDSNIFLNIKKILDQNEVKKIVVGYPIGMKGQRTVQTQKVEKFVEELKKNVKSDIILIDERLSSISAIASLIKQGIKTGHNKSMIDETSAAIILQEYLDGQ